MTLSDTRRVVGMDGCSHSLALRLVDEVVPGI
jgi:hypothetical protein